MKPIVELKEIIKRRAKDEIIKSKDLIITELHNKKEELRLDYERQKYKEGSMFLISFQEWNNSCGKINVDFWKMLTLYSVFLTPFVFYFLTSLFFKGTILTGNSAIIVSFIFGFLGTILYTCFWILLNFSNGNFTKRKNITKLSEKYYNLNEKIETKIIDIEKINWILNSAFKEIKDKELNDFLNTPLVKDDVVILKEYFNDEEMIKLLKISKKRNENKITLKYIDIIHYIKEENEYEDLKEMKEAILN